MDEVANHLLTTFTSSALSTLGMWRLSGPHAFLVPEWNILAVNVYGRPPPGRMSNVPPFNIWSRLHPSEQHHLRRTTERLCTQMDNNVSTLRDRQSIGAQIEDDVHATFVSPSPHLSRQNASNAGEQHDNGAAFSSLSQLLRRWQTSRSSTKRDNHRIALTSQGDKRLASSADTKASD